MVLNSENTPTNIIFPLKVAGKMMKSVSMSGIYVRFLKGGIPLIFFPAGSREFFRPWKRR